MMHIDLVICVQNDLKLEQLQRRATRMTRRMGSLMLEEVRRVWLVWYGQAKAREGYFLPL